VYQPAARATLRDRGTDCPRDEGLVGDAGHPPANDPAAVTVQYRCEMKHPLQRGDLFHIGTPKLVRRVGCEGAGNEVRPRLHALNPQDPAGSGPAVLGRDVSATICETRINLATRFTFTATPSRSSCACTRLDPYVASLSQWIARIWSVITTSDAARADGPRAAHA
jgi:hypothetical protein